jgi:hypothetical protein
MSSCTYPKKLLDVAVAVAPLRHGPGGRVHADALFAEPALAAGQDPRVLAVEVSNASPLAVNDLGSRPWLTRNGGSTILSSHLPSCARATQQSPSITIICTDVYRNKNAGKSHEELY